MQMQTVVRQMEEYIQDFRAQLKKKDMDSIKTMTANMQRFFGKLEDELPANVDFGQQFKTIVDCANRFGTACSKNDMQEAAKALSDMELTAKAIEKQCAASAA